MDWVHAGLRRAQPKIVNASSNSRAEGGPRPFGRCVFTAEDFFFLRDVLERNSEKTKIAWPKNEQPKMPHTAMPYTFSIRRRVCGVGSLHGPPKFALLGVLALA